MVLSLNEATGRLEPHRVLALLDMGVKPVYQITTASGKTLKTTLTHPYLTKNGWRKLKDIEIGEEIRAAGEYSYSRFTDISDGRGDGLRGNGRRELLPRALNQWLKQLKDWLTPQSSFAGQIITPIAPTAVINSQEVTLIPKETFKKSEAILPANQSGKTPPIKVWDTKRLLSVVQKSIFSINLPHFGNKKYTTPFHSSQDNLRTILDPIISIDYLGNLPVYDIEVEGTHNFIAQGIVAHNTYSQGDQKPVTRNQKLEETVSSVVKLNSLDPSKEATRKLYSDKPFSTIGGKWQQISNYKREVGKFRVYINPAAGKLTLAVEIAQQILSQNDAPEAAFKYLITDEPANSDIIKQPDSTKLVFYLKTPGDALKLVKMFLNHQKFDEMKGNPLRDTIAINNTIMITGGTRESIDWHDLESLARTIEIAKVFLLADIPLYDVITINQGIPPSLNIEKLKELYLQGIALSFDYGKEIILEKISIKNGEISGIPSGTMVKGRLRTPIKIGNPIILIDDSGTTPVKKIEILDKNTLRVHTSTSVYIVKKVSSSSPATSLEKDDSRSALEPKGGIDLNPANLNMEVISKGGTSSSPLKPISLDLQNFQGFSFQIIRVRSADSWEAALGLSSQETAAFVS